MKDIEVVWTRIHRHAGQRFRTKTGLPFTYRCRATTFAVDRVNRSLSKANFLFGDDGSVDRAKVLEACEDVAKRLGLNRAPTPNHVPGEGRAPSRDRSGNDLGSEGSDPRTGRAPPVVALGAWPMS